VILDSQIEPGSIRIQRFITRTLIASYKMTYNSFYMLISSAFNHLILQIYHFIFIYIYKRLSVICTHTNVFISYCMTFYHFIFIL